MSENTPTLLPLGSAVKIKNDDSLYVIISRGFQKKGQEVMAGYAGVPHPFGEGSKYKKIVIPSDAILEVVQRGYEDALDQQFVQTQLGNAAEAPKVSAAPAKEPGTGTQEMNSKVPEVPKEERTKGADEHPNDPFYHLKHQGKRKGE